MSHLFAAILLFSSPNCPHEEPSCITASEYVEINLTFLQSRNHFPATPR